MNRVATLAGVMPESERAVLNRALVTGLVVFLVCLVIIEVLAVLSPAPAYG